MVFYRFKYDKMFNYILFGEKTDFNLSNVI